MGLRLLGYVITLLWKKHSTKRAFNLRRKWVKHAQHILGIQVVVKGTAPHETCLYVCNHRSFSDPVIICLYVDAFVIAKAEVQNIPLLRKGAELTGIIYVKREDKNSRSATREMLVETILAGENVMVYPEGTVSAGKQTLPFKSGTFLEAAKHKIPVVPVALEYRDEVDLWEKRSLISQYLRQFGKAKTECKMEIGPKMQHEDGIVLKSMAQDWINNKLLEMQDGWSRVKFEG